MPPRIHRPAKATANFLCCKAPRHQHYATAAVAVSPAQTHPQLYNRTLPPTLLKPHFPSTQPPSHKPPEFRKTQLLRQYASLLRSNPLLLVFQHNNIKSTEWIALRRELNLALQKVDEAQVAAGMEPSNIAGDIKIQIVQTGILAAALRVVEFYKPGENGEELTHTLSKSAHEAASSRRTELQPLLSGPLALLTFPDVSPAHLKAALSILSPSAPGFPAPKKKANPGWHDPPVQAAVQKLLLMAARVDGKVFDVDGTKWVGGIEGGLSGLQAQLVHLLQSVGSGLTNTLESSAKSLYLTVEGRRGMLEDEANGVVKEETKE